MERGHQKVGNKKYLSRTELVIGTAVFILVPVLGAWILSAWCGYRKHQAVEAAKAAVPV